jgi:hypothetical protein
VGRTASRAPPQPGSSRDRGQFAEQIFASRDCRHSQAKDTIVEIGEQGSRAGSYRSLCVVQRLYRELSQHHSRAGFMNRGFSTTVHEQRLTLFV